MDIRQLEYCLAVAQRGSFTKAADELFITRQALSKAVRNLEQELGEPLFVNRDGTLRITPLGEDLLRDARPVVSAFQELTQRYLNAEGPKVTVRNLSIALVPGAALTLPEDLIECFGEAHSDVLISVENAPTEVALDMVAQGESDIALVGSAPQYLADFECLLVVRTAAYLHVPLSNPLSQKEVLELSDLEGQPMVTFGKRDHLHRYFVDLCAKQGIEPNIFMTASNLDVLLRAVHQNKALMFGLPPRDGIPANPDFPLVPLKTDDTVFGTYAVKRKGESLAPAAQAFWDYLANLAIQMP